MKTYFSNGMVEDYPYFLDEDCNRFYIQELEEEYTVDKCYI